MYDLILTNMWIVYICIIIGVTTLLQILGKHVVRHLTNKAEKLNVIFGEALLKAISIPMVLLSWLFALSFCSSIILTHKNYYFLAATHLPIRTVAIIIILCWALVRFILRFEALYIQACTQSNKVIDKTLIHALSQLSTIAICILGLLIVLQIMDIPIAGLLAFGGIGGASVAFASKELLANFFGGLIIYMDKPFKVGDWIRSPDKNIEGIVEYIGWRMTRIRTFEKRPLYVPNSVFLTISVENPSRMQHRRIKANIGIRYQDSDKVNAISTQIREMLLQHTEIDSSQSMTVSLVEFAPSALNIMVSAYSKMTKWDQFQIIQHEILINILNVITKNGAQCAFPTQTVYTHVT
jgi:MscS family membrane protein